MGLFSKKEPTEEWFYSKDGEKAYYKAVRDDIEYEKWHHEGRRPNTFKYFHQYIDSLPNIKKLMAEDIFVDRHTLISNLLMLSEFKQVDEFGVEHDAKFAGYPNFFNPQINWYLDFVQKLNHAYFGWMMEVIDKLILHGYVDTDDEWLYDTELFRVDDDESDTFRRVKNKIISLGIDIDNI